MAAKVTMINRADPSIRREMFTVDAKEMLANDPTGWRVYDPRAEQMLDEQSAAAKAVSAAPAAKTSPAKKNDPLA